MNIDLEELKKNAKIVRNASRDYKAIVAVADALGDMATLEAYISEKQALVTDLSLKALDAEQAISSALAVASLTEQEANAQAAQTVAGANQKAVAIVRAAEEKVQAALSARDALANEIELLKREVSSFEAKAEKAVADYVAKDKELKSMEKKVEALKAQLLKMAGV